MSIKTNSIVVNAEVYDSDEDIEDTNFEEEIEEVNYQSCDEDTENVSQFLQELLYEIATVYACGKMKVRVEFNDPHLIEFCKKDEVCEFDYDEDTGYPIMPDGGENFFIPYMEELKTLNSDLERLKVETNVKGFKFKL